MNKLQVVGCLYHMRIRDTIHGMIYVSPLEMEIINTFPFQRLRYIRQLATTYMVYPGAEHTRFGHSIGTMHIASRVIQSIKQKSPNCFFKRKHKQEAHWAWMEQMLRLIALTHDLGHPPFSHAGEGLLPEKKKHEDYTREIILNTEIGEIINQIGIEFKKNHGDDFEITSQQVVDIYSGGIGKHILNNYENILNYLMDSELDCDKMDYLLRDSHYCGVKYGHYDLERLLSAIDVADSVINDKVKVIVIHEDGVHAFEEFVLARYFMFLQVYFHKTRRILDITLYTFLRSYLPEGHYPESISEYLRWDDNRILQGMNDKTDSNEIKQYKNRSFPRMVYHTNAHAGISDSEKYNKVKRVLINKNVCLENELIEDDASKLPHNIPTIVSDGEKAVYVLKKDSSTTNIRSSSFLLDHLSNKIHIQRIYVPHGKKEKAIKMIKNLHY